MCFHSLRQLVRQFDSDTVCLEMVSERAQSLKALLPTPASDTGCKSRLLLMLLTWLEVLMTLFSVENTGISFLLSREMLK